MIKFFSVEAKNKRLGKKISKMRSKVINKRLRLELKREQRNVKNLNRIASMLKKSKSSYRK